MAQTKLKTQGIEADLVTKGMAMQVVAYDQTCEVAGYIQFQVPDSWNGMNVVNFETNLVTAGTTGTMVAHVERYRGAWVDFCTSGISFASGAFTGTFTIDTSNDDISSGDLIRVRISAIHTTPAEGLNIVMELRKP